METNDRAEPLYLTEDELVKRIHKTLNESNIERKKHQIEERSSRVKFEAGDTESRESHLHADSDKDLSDSSCISKSSMKDEDTQSKYQVYANSIRYFEKLNGQLHQLKQNDENEEMKPASGDHSEEESASFKKKFLKDMGRTAKSRPSPKTILTASTSSFRDNEMSIESDRTEIENCLSRIGEMRRLGKGDPRKIRDADDFSTSNLEPEMVQDNQSDTEKVLITKNDMKYFEDIASRNRVDDKQQRYFEKDRKKVDIKVETSEAQQVNKKEVLYKDITSKVKQIPVNITNSELDGLKGYLLQLKELIARRETAWARTTERDYSQRVEITRFKNEVSHLRMLCDKRTRELREKDHIIQSKDDEIAELSKKISQMKTSNSKKDKLDSEKRTLNLVPTEDRVEQKSLEDPDHELSITYIHSTPESKPIKKNSGASKPVTAFSNSKLTPNPFFAPGVVKNRDLPTKKPKEKTREIKIEASPETKIVLEKKSVQRKIKSSVLQQVMNEDPNVKAIERKLITEVDGTTQASTDDNIEVVDDKLQKMEEILHDEIIKANEKKKPNWKPAGKLPAPQYRGLDTRTEIDGRPLPRRGFTAGSYLKSGGEDVLGVLTGTSNNSNNTKKSRTILKTQGPASIFQNSFFMNGAYVPLR